jgi:hypothetical protein
MHEDKIGPVGFELPERRERVRKHRRATFAHLITTAALVFSIVVAATAVSYGIARAGAAAPHAGRQAAPRR